jgi:predicted ATPase
MVLELQLERERAIEPGHGPVFLDRGIADGIAYYRKSGLEPPSRMIDLCSGRYAGAVVLDTLERFDGRSFSGRMSDRDDSLHIGRLIELVYRELGVEVSRLAATTLEDRIEAVLTRFGHGL